MSGSIISNNRDTIFRNGNGDNVQRVSSGGVIDGLSFGSLYGAFPDDVTEIYTYYKGEMVTLLLTVTVVYRNSNKCEIVSLVRLWA